MVLKLGDGCVKKAIWTLAALLFLMSSSETNLYATSGSVLKEDVIVVFESEEEKAIEVPMISKEDIALDYVNIPAIAMSMTNADMEVLRKKPNIKGVFIDKEVKLLEKTDSLIDIEAGVQAQGEDWGIEHTNVKEAWKEGYTGKGVKVAVIDTGIDSSHDDLIVSGGVSFVDGESKDDYVDENGHGTHVAGIIGAKDNGSDYVGTAPDIQLYAVKVFDASGTGKISKILAGVDWSITNGMDVINISLGSEEGYDAYEKIFQEAYDKGIVVVTSAGNDFEEPKEEGGCEKDSAADCVDYPGVYKTTITVGAIESGNKVAPFSSAGPSVDFAAPGVGVVSTYLFNTNVKLSGTSMASPYVAGIVALLKQKYPNATPLEIKNILIKNATDIGEVGKDAFTGYGLVRAEFDVIAPFDSKITTLTHSNLYTEADVSTKTSASVSPQVVTAFERKGSMFHIKTWLGNRWIEPEHYIIGEAEKFEFKVKLLATEHLYSYPSSDEKLSASLSPQTVRAYRKTGDYIEVKTWLGRKWLKTTNYEREIQVVEFKDVITLTSRTDVLVEPKSSSKTGATLSPQTVNAVRKTDDGMFYEINTWMGKKWIKPVYPLVGKVDNVDELISLGERKHLHEHPYGETKMSASVSPQTVRAMASWRDSQGNTWLKINTWIGHKWIKK